MHAFSVGLNRLIVFTCAFNKAIWFRDDNNDVNDEKAENQESREVEILI